MDSKLGTAEPCLGNTKLIERGKFGYQIQGQTLLRSVLLICRDMDVSIWMSHIEQEILGTFRVI